MEDLLQVGVIANTHGLQGEVKVFPTTDDVKRFKKLREAWLDTGAGMTALEVSQVKFFKNLVSFLIFLALLHILRKCSSLQRMRQEGRIMKP